MTTPRRTESVAVNHHATEDSAIEREFFDRISKTVPVTDILLVTSFPRGGLLVTQTLRPDEGLLSAYAHEFHAEDRLTWRVIQTGAVTTTEQAWGGAPAFAASEYHRQLLHGAGLEHGVGFPLTAPLLEGYAGALHVYRSNEQGAFGAHEIAELTRLVAELDQRLLERKVVRQAEHCDQTSPWGTRPSVHQFIFDHAGNVVVGAAALNKLDESLREAVRQRAGKLLHPVVEEGKKSPAVTWAREQLADSYGDLWTFRSASYQRYPSLGDGRFVMFCLQPDACAWSALRPSDFKADEEVARLIPSLEYMRAHFASGPGLVKISHVVHLSPFHFHRRFTELMGLTPKHYMLEVQIDSAKRQLMGREIELADIAKHCGFAHQSHFTSRFKQATGLTPTRWRRQVGDRLMSNA